MNNSLSTIALEIIDCEQFLSLTTFKNSDFTPIKKLSLVFFFLGILQCVKITEFSTV